ncbi:MAG: type II toxin-antitoxin system RelE/ParE family toxin [Hymenobacter sp.]|nr:MAG: type II toxin-antitoxin system RelE/ParE family toxin [Hymenobacter sp.]
MGTISWSRRIIADIYAASEYHRPFAPAFADKLIEDIFAKGRLLETQPLLGRVVPEAGRADIRELLHKKYRIIYQVATAESVILLALHPTVQPLSATSLL